MITRPQARPAAILIGPPGAGKTTVGGLLAERLGLGFTDTDAVVESAAGKAVADIFIEDGEQAFRALERQAAEAAIAGQPGIVGLGGGAVLDAGTQELLAGQHVVYLETGLSEAMKRVGLDRPRPLLAVNPRAQLRALLQERLPIYAKLAWITVSTDGRDPGDIATEIVGQLGAGAAGGQQRGG